MSAVQLHNLRKVHENGFVALDGVTLDIADGEFFVLLGPSGCGKTTVLRMVAGVDSPTHGDVRFDGVSVVEVPSRDRNVSMVFQNYALYPTMTVRENIGFSLRVGKVKKSTAASSVNDIAAAFELTELLDRLPSQLSGGERQRVAMARAMLREPNVFLMDEPLANLDASLREKVRSEVSRLQRRVGVTMLYVTHDQVEAMSMGDRVALFEDGKIVQVGSPLELYEAPRNRFVAEFLGTHAINMFRATVIEQDDKLSVLIGSQCLALGRNANRFSNLWAFVGREVLCGLRPESIGRGGAGVLDVSIEFVEQLGHELLVSANLISEACGDGSTPSIRASLPIGTHVPRWEAISFSVDTERIHLFDVETGESLANLH